MVYFKSISFKHGSYPWCAVSSVLGNKVNYSSCEAVLIRQLLDLVSLGSSVLSDCPASTPLGYAIPNSCGYYCIFALDRAYKFPLSHILKNGII